MTARIHVHTAKFGLRFADMDALGHVNNAAYFTFMEQARLEWLGRHAPDAYKTGAGPVIANATCNFRIPLVYPKDLEVRMYLGKPGRTSVESHYEILADGTIHADGGARIVWIDFATGRPTPLPAHIADPLRAQVEETK